MPDAYSFGRGTNGPGNITPPMPGTGNGGIAQALLAGRFGSGGGFGYGRGFRGAGRKPGLDLPPPPGMEDLTQTQGPYDPEKLYGIRGKGGPNNPSTERLQAMSSAAGWSQGMFPRGRGLTQGAGFGQPDDILRRLLEARMGGGF